MKETHPLLWPQGWPRTRIADREARAAWKKTERQSIEALELELKRFAVLSATLTRKDPSDFRGPSDPSISVSFSRKREDDFSWQDALGIHDPAPSLEEITAIYRKLVAPHHPDQGGDPEMFRALTTHKNNALAYVNRLSGQTYEYAIACDKFKEARWNITAIRLTVHSLRQIERDGTSALLQQAMKGFAAIAEHAGQE
ncbi:MAG: hypothetical protein ABSF14_19785 [Terriglobia bacterium]|jgi:hypothetical protein